MTRCTSAPEDAQRASVPPQLTSGSSGWANTASARSGMNVSITSVAPPSEGTLGAGGGSTSVPAMVDPLELCALAESTARAAGALLLAGLDQVRTDIQTKSTGTDMVSEMDRAAEALIVERLLGARPDDGMM